MTTTPLPLTAASNGLSMDAQSLNALKGTASRDPRAAVKAAAQQMEGLFMQELMKSMRASTMSSGMLDNSGTEMGTQMLDTQLATRMTGMPGGLSEAIERQLGRQLGPQTAPTSAAGSTAGSSTGSVLGLDTGDRPLFSREVGSLVQGDLSRTLPARGQATAALAPAGAAGAPTGQADIASNPAIKPHLRPAAEFVSKNWEAAKAIEAETGIPAGNLIGQAAHETGWGRHMIRNKDGSSSNNLFGIKATADWKGKVAEVTTTEYIGGVARKVTAKFRAYDSVEESFRDHARLLTTNDRYSKVVANADTAQGYAKNLQRAGYATDPAYADKLTRVINTALRLQRAVT